MSSDKKLKWFSWWFVYVGVDVWMSIFVFDQFMQHFTFYNRIIPQQVRTDNNEDELLFFRVAEGIFVGWFTLEYLVRYMVAPQKADIILIYLLLPDNLTKFAVFLHYFLPQYN